MLNKFKWPKFIAEISANHCGKIEIAKKLIKCAKENGADAVKLQTYTADTMTINSKKKYFKINSGLWKNKYLYELYDKASTPLKWHKELFSYAKKIKIKIFSTPFDESAVDFLEKLNCPLYKVASFEMNDHLLIKKIAQTKKPIIISTGMASLDEIKESYNIAKKYGAKHICLLYCVSNYPSKIEDFNLNNILILKKNFKCTIGLSDHSNNNMVSIIARSEGAEVFEKHIALKNQKKGFDIAFSLKGDQIKSFIEQVNLVDKIKGKKFFYRNKSEKKSLIFRRSIFAINNIKKGEKFTKSNIRKIRPGYGISPKFYSEVLGKKSTKNISSEEPILKNHFR